MSERLRGTIYTDVNYCLLIPEDDSGEQDSHLLMQEPLTPFFKKQLEKAVYTQDKEPFPRNLEHFLASLVQGTPQYNPRSRSQDVDWEQRSIVTGRTLRGFGKLDYMVESSMVHEYAKGRIDPFTPNTELIQALNKLAVDEFQITLLSNLSYLARSVLIDRFRGFGPTLNPDLMAILRPTGLRSSPGLKVATFVFHSLADPAGQIPSYFIDDDPLIIEEVGDLGVCNGIYIPRTYEQLGNQPLLQQQALERILRNNSRVVIRGDGKSVEDEISKMLNL